jgi:hypothetical protein
LRSPHPPSGWPQLLLFSPELPQGWPSRRRFWGHLGCTYGDHRGGQIFPIFPTLQRRQLSSHLLQGRRHLPCGWPQGPPSAHRPSQGMIQQLLPPGTSQSHPPSWQSRGQHFLSNLIGGRPASPNTGDSLPASRVTLGVANSSQRVAQHPPQPGAPWVAKGVAAAATLDISTTWGDSPVLQLLLGGDGFGSAPQYLPSPPTSTSHMVCY